MLRRLVAGALLLLAVASPALAALPPFPFRTIGDLHIEQMVPGACGETQITIVYTVEENGVRWKILSGDARDVYLRIEQDAVIAVYFTESGKATEGRIIVKKAMTLEEAKAAFPLGPCSYISSVDA